MRKVVTTTGLIIVAHSHHLKIVSDEGWMEEQKVSERDDGRSEGAKHRYITELRTRASAFPSAAFAEPHWPQSTSGLL